MVPRTHSFPGEFWEGKLEEMVLFLILKGFQYYLTAWLPGVIVYRLLLYTTCIRLNEQTTLYCIYRNRAGVKKANHRIQ
jgi:hypothetical protein